MPPFTINFLLVEAGRSLQELVNENLEKITVDTGDDIMDLKYETHARILKSSPNFKVARSELTFWKLTTPIDLNRMGTLGQRFPSSEVSDIAVNLRTNFRDTISDIFEDLSKNHLHMIVGYSSTQPLSMTTISPSSSSSTASSIAIAQELPFIAQIISRRKRTVKQLYNTMLSEHLVHVRGTPGSGKSTLLGLLHHYIRKKNPGAPIFEVNRWSEPTTYDAHLRAMDISFPNASRETFYLFDEAQDLYWDAAFWNDFLKGVTGRGTCYRIIMFCSYGSPTARPVDHPIGIPLELSPEARISLWPRVGETEYGLCFTKEEFDEAVTRHEDPLALAPELQDMIYNWTAGQVGAATDLLRLISNQRKGETRDGVQRTCEVFLAQNPVQVLVDQNFSGSFTRGFPTCKALQDQPGAVKILRKMLRDGVIEDRNLDTEETEGLRICHRRGWVHGEPIGKTGYSRYVPPSPFHAMRLSWQLDPTDSKPSYNSLFTLSCAIISKFKPSQLGIPIRRAGVAATSRPPEAQYQDEFYRGLFDATEGSVRFSPEFSSAQGSKQAGRIDFFIPIVKWGVELTRDGSQLSVHDARFGVDGPYGAWMNTGEMVDYVLLDFRSTKPRNRHPRIPNLYHVVFSPDYTTVSVFNNEVELVVGPITLLENHLYC